MTDKEKLEAFKKELKELLKKYDANLACDIDGDTHGLDCEMRVEMLNDGKWKDSFLSNGNCLDWNDL